MLRRLTRREAIGLAGAATLGGGVLAAKLDVGRSLASFFKGLDHRRNVILIVADAMRADVIGRTYQGAEITPTLNALAAENVYFSNAYSASSQTKFSVASMLTGLYPPAHGVESYARTLPDCLAVQSWMRGQGYQTFGAIANPFLEQERVSIEYGEIDFGFGRGFDTYKNLLHPLEAGSELDDKEEFFCQYVPGEDVNNTFVSYLKGREGGAFFAYLHYMDSHQPWMRHVALPEVRARFLPAGASTAEREAADKNLVLTLLLEENLEALQEQAKLEALHRIYYEGCAYVDKCIGELLTGLRERGLYKDSIVIVTSDHGEELFEHGCVGHAQNLFEPQIRVPLILVGSERFRLAKTVDAKVSNAMVFPTLMDLFGENHPCETAYSLLPLVEGSFSKDLDVFATLFGQDALIAGNGAKAVLAGGRWQVYDIEKDPGESRPMPADTENAAVRTCIRMRSFCEGIGVEPRFSTHCWQNPMYSTQEERAKAIRRSRVKTWGQLEHDMSRGCYLSEDELRELDKSTLSGRTLAPKVEKQLKALGYLH